jgi:hypothetical protein
VATVADTAGSGARVVISQGDSELSDLRGKVKTEPQKDICMDDAVN